MTKRPHRDSSSIPEAALDAADPIITIDVGGRQFRSYRSTLTKYDSKVKYILNGRLPGLIGDATVFLDLSPTHFDILLDFMRHDRLLLPPRFDDAELLRHAAEQLWLFECLRAVDRWEAGGPDARAEPDLAERKPTRYVQIRLQQEQPLTAGAALSAVPISGSLTTGFGVADLLDDIFGPAAQTRVGSSSSSQRLRSADQVRAFLEAAQAALEGLGGARVFADGQVTPGSPVNFVEIYAVPEADESSLPPPRTPPNSAWPPSPSPLSPSAWSADLEPPHTPPGNLSVDYYHPHGNGSDID